AHQQVAFGSGIAAEHLQRAMVRSQAQQRLDHRGLASAIAPDQSQDAARPYREIHPSHSLLAAAVLLGQPARLDDWRHYFCSVRVGSGGVAAPVVSVFRRSWAESPRRWMVAWILGHSLARKRWRSSV